MQQILLGVLGTQSRGGMLGVYRRIEIEVSGIRVVILAGHSHKSQLALLVPAHTEQESHISASGHGFLHPGECEGTSSTSVERGKCLAGISPGIST